MLDRIEEGCTVVQVGERAVDDLRSRRWDVDPPLRIFKQLYAVRNQERLSPQRPTRGGPVVLERVPIGDRRGAVGGHVQTDVEAANHVVQHRRAGAVDNVDPGACARANDGIIHDPAKRNRRRGLATDRGDPGEIDPTPHRRRDHVVADHRPGQQPIGVLIPQHRRAARLELQRRLRDTPWNLVTRIGRADACL